MMNDARTTRPRCRALRGVRVLATGSYVPDSVVTNEHLREKFGCKPEWLVKHTGMHERRQALSNQATSDLGVEAVQRCLEQARIAPGDIDLLLLATNSPDMSFPSTACLVQDRLGLNCPAVDLQAGCAGFMYALVTGASYVLAGASNLALVVGADCNSRIVDHDDMKTYPLFGDGAGVCLLARGRPDQGLLSYSMGSDGSGGNLLFRRAGGSRLPANPECVDRRDRGEAYMAMDGRAVFSWAVSILCDTIQDVLDDTGIPADAISLFVPHQANIRIINAAIDVLHIPRSRVFCNLDRYGNTSAGSIPLALDEACAEGRIREGDLVVLAGFGAGLTWGTALLRW